MKYIATFCVALVITLLGQWLLAPAWRDQVYASVADADVGPFPPGTAIRQGGQVVAVVTDDNKLHYPALPDRTEFTYPLRVYWRTGSEQPGKRHGMVLVGRLIIRTGSVLEYERVFLRDDRDKVPGGRYKHHEAILLFASDWQRCRRLACKWEKDALERWRQAPEPGDKIKEGKPTSPTPKGKGD